MNFNEAKIIEDIIKVNRAVVWYFSKNAGTLAHKPALTEPFIPNFERWNSNSGWVNPASSTWNDIMQALSHFTYHASEGKFLLCDLQGGRIGHHMVLTDPVVMTPDRQYGVTDLGLSGIYTFFINHRCNCYCKDKGWRLPGNQLLPNALPGRPVLPPKILDCKQGTTMIL